MKQLLLILSVFATSISWSQTGFFGAKNAVELRISTSPTLGHVNKIKDNISYRNKKWVNNTYSINFCRTTTRKVEFSAGYRFASYKAPVDLSHFHTYDTIVQYPWGNEEVHDHKYTFLENPKITGHVGLIGARFYVKGALAPIGKFIGFNLQFGRVGVGPNTDLTYGSRGEYISKSPFKRSYEIGELFTGNLQESYRIVYGSMLLELGSVFPINQYLSITGTFKFPLIFGASGQGRLHLGPFIDNKQDVAEGSYWSEFLSNTAKTYTRAALEVSLKYHF